MRPQNEMTMSNDNSMKNGKEHIIRQKSQTNVSSGGNEHSIAAAYDISHYQK